MGSRFFFPLLIDIKLVIPSGCSLWRAGPFTSYRICGGICDVELLVDDWPHRQAFQPDACKFYPPILSIILFLGYLERDVRIRQAG